LVPDRRVQRDYELGRAGYLSVVVQKKSSAEIPAEMESKPLFHQAHQHHMTSTG